MTACAKSVPIDKTRRFQSAAMCIALAAGICGAADPSRASPAVAVAAKHLPPPTAQVTLIAGKRQPGSLHKPATLQGRPTATAYSPDSKLIAFGGGAETVRVWNLGGAEVSALSGHAKGVRTLAFAPDSKTLASVDATGRVRLWDTTAGAQKDFDPPLGPITSIVFSADGGLLALGGKDGTVELRPVEGAGRPSEPLRAVGEYLIEWLKDR